METQEKPSVWDIFLRTIAVLGLIAVLLLGAWGIIQLAVSLPSVFGGIGNSVSSLFSGGAHKETLAVSAPSSAASSQQITVSWTHQNGNGDYAYSLSYACQNGLSLKAPLPTGSYQTIACNTPFNFVNASAHMIVIPVASVSQPVPLTLTVTATQLSTGAITTTGSATTNITGTATQPKTSAYTSPAPTMSYQPAPVRATLYGYPDLAVRYVGVVPQGGLTALQFSVENNGTNVTPAGWTFNAQLPVNGGYTFVSQPQQALYPGDKILYTLSFQTPSQYQTGYPYGYTSNGYGYTGQGSYACSGYIPCIPPTQYGYPYQNYGYGYTGSVTIMVDPYNYIPELNKINNRLTVPLSVY
ncbi:MAG: hypothetical protein KGH79_00210 [Patescibacteria group bacterium]|nr:hypothetical protein [Patescibacteria group bacterium]